MAVDPLSLLLSKKKEEKATKPQATAVGTSLTSGGGSEDPGGGLGSLSGGAAKRTTNVATEFDVSAALGGGGGARPQTSAGGYPVSGAPAVASPPKQSVADFCAQPAPAAPAASASPAPPPKASGLFGEPLAAPSPAPTTIGHRRVPEGTDAYGGASAATGSSATAGQDAGAPQRPATFDDMLEAEKVHVNVKNCFLLVNNPMCEVRGRLLVTNYRLKFQTPKGTLREELRWMQDCKYFDVPMGAIEDAKEERSTTVAGVPELKLRVTTKDLRTLCFLLVQEEESRNVLQAIAAFSYPGNTTLLFAFKHAEEVWKSQPPNEDNLYEPMQEYLRMGIETELIPNPDCPWHVSNINSQYGLCQTYPSVLALPKAISDQELRAVAGFRKRGRLPAMSWCGGPELHYASLWRCSQTTEGFMGQKCPEDQKLVDCIRTGGPQQRQQDRDLLIIDLRPWKSAWANKAGGGGFEGYPRCKLVFGGIDNIHCVRDAWKSMGAAVAAVSDNEVGTWMKDVANSNWYDYIGAILNSALRVVKEILDNHSSVMVHCSDGWDRTAQASSLAMLCLDYSYRTQAGLLRLIQKEWCSFGHKFRTRAALGEQPTPESSPVFVQWLECVSQLCAQFPTAFEFTPGVLLRLASEVYSNKYGTFLTDCERERSQKVAPFTMSLWSALLRPEELPSWRNPRYVQTRGPLIPSISQASYDVWEAYWFRYHVRGARSKADEASPPAHPRNPPPPSDPPISTAPSAPQVGVPVQQTPAPVAVTDAPNFGAAPAQSAPPALAGDTLFSPQELVAPQANSADSTAAAPKKKAAPTQVFADDDDDEDIFASKSTGKRTAKPAPE